MVDDQHLLALPRQLQGRSVRLGRRAEHGNVIAGGVSAHGPTDGRAGTFRPPRASSGADAASSLGDRRASPHGMWECDTGGHRGARGVAGAARPREPLAGPSAAGGRERHGQLSIKRDDGREVSRSLRRRGAPDR